MRDLRIVLNDAVSARHGDLAVRLAGPEQTFKLKIDGIEKPLSTELEDLPKDFLEIAAAVFAADSSFSRGGNIREGFGADWRRGFRFICPVRLPEFWSRDDVRAALADTVSFLTDDAVDFEFVEAENPPYAEAYLPFDAPSNEGLMTDDVLMFSGGLDSLAGAVELLSTTDRPLTLVSHKSAPKVSKRQEDLINALQRKFPKRVRWIPVEATRAGSEALERSQRSRSFFFAALGFAVARMVAGRRLLFFENGVVSANLPFARQIIGTMATRTTHPESLQLLQALLSKFPGPAVELANPFAWETKRDVVARLDAHDATELINTSISCTKVYNRSKRLTHCGECTQCLDRRFALVAAGLGDHDAPSHYETEVFTDERTSDASRTLALEWTRHALEMPTDELGFYAKFGSELPRLVDGFPEMPEVEAAQRLLALHLRHRDAVRLALERAFDTSRSALLVGEVPATALIRMIQDPREVPTSSGPRRRAGDGEKAPARRAPTADEPWPAQLHVVSETPKPVVDVIAVETFSGEPARVILALKPRHDADHAKLLPREKFTYLPTDKLLDALNADDSERVRKVIERLRRDLREALEIIGVEDVEDQPLVQSRRPLGYRLDPLARFVEPDDG